jgi:hypothetical protein
MRADPVRDDVDLWSAEQIKRFERNSCWPSAKQIGRQLGPGGAEADSYVKVETPGFAGVSRGSGGGIRTRDLRVMSASPSREIDAAAQEGAGT